MILLKHIGRPVFKHVGLWQTPATAAAGLLMVILLQHRGAPSRQTRGAEQAAEFLRLKLC